MLSHFSRFNFTYLPRFSFSLEAVTYNESISSTEPRSLTYGFEQKHIGRYEDRLELVFEDTQLKKRFVISRLLRAIVGNQAEHEALRPIAPYVPRKRTTRTPESQVVPGVPPPSSTAIPYVSRLPFADIPVNLSNLLTDSQSSEKKLADIKRLYLSGLFSSQTYARHFKCLLWIEEHRTEWVPTISLFL
jgi:helicase MOV-10